MGSGNLLQDLINQPTFVPSACLPFIRRCCFGIMHISNNIATLEINNRCPHMTAKVIHGLYAGRIQHVHALILRCDSGDVVTITSGILYQILACFPSLRTLITNNIHVDRKDSWVVKVNSVKHVPNYMSNYAHVTTGSASVITTPTTPLVHHDVSGISYLFIGMSREDRPDVSTYPVAVSTHRHRPGSSRFAIAISESAHQGLNRYCHRNVCTQISVQGNRGAIPHAE